MYEICRMCLKDDTNHNFYLFSYQLIENLSVYEVYTLLTSIFVDQEVERNSKICQECLLKLKSYYNDRCQAITNNDVIISWGNKGKGKGKLKTIDKSKCSADVKLEIDILDEASTFMESNSVSEFVEVKVKSEPNYDCTPVNIGETVMVKPERSLRKGLRTKKLKDRFLKKASKKTTKLEKTSSKLPKKSPLGAICPYCGKKLKQRLERHIERVHLKLKNYSCDMCARAFFSKSALRDHLLRHIGNRNYNCDKCLESFCTNHDLLAHGHKVHEGRTDFRCVYKECKKNFTCQGSLKEHINNIHLGLKQYVCHCGLGFFRKEMFKEHALKHIENLQASFVCEFCEKKFISERKLNRHTKFQHTTPKLKCNFCDKTCVTKRRLREHENVHKNIREYSCSHCEKAYSTRANLMMHIKDNHFKSKISCELCGSKLARRENYLMHAKSVHKDLETAAMDALIAKIKTIKADYERMEYIYT